MFKLVYSWVPNTKGRGGINEGLENSSNLNKHGALEQTAVVGKFFKM